MATSDDDTSPVEAGYHLPSHFDLESDRGRRSIYLRKLNLGWLIMGGIALISMPFYREQLFLLLPIAGITGATFLAVRFLENRGSTTLAAVIFCSIVDLAFLLFFLLHVSERGVAQALETRATVLMMMGLAIGFSAALIGKRAPFVFALLNSLTLLTLVLLAGDHQVSARFSIHVFWWMLALAGWLYERSLESAFVGLRRARADLEDLVDSRTLELRKTIEQLESAKSDLEAANQELESFSFSVSHDLRSPLRSIEGFCRVLLEDHSERLDQEGTEHLTRILAASLRMRDLIHDLLNLARVTRSRLRLKTVDLSALAEAIAEDQKEADPKRTVEFVVRPDLVGRGDPNLLRVVLENLLENACKFSRSRDRPRVEFGCQEGNGNVFFVRDNGVGFEMARADRLFGAFQRLHGHEFEGTGIGLATVSRIIRRHGGRVWAEAKPDQGATFFFTLSRRQV